MSNATAPVSLFDRTEDALCLGQWSSARALLDDLAYTDHALLLEDLSVYEAIVGVTLPPAFVPVLQDRIELANAVAERCRG